MLAYFVQALFDRRGPTVAKSELVGTAQDALFARTVCREPVIGL